MKKIYQNAKIRAVVSGILTVLSNVFLAILGQWNKDQAAFGWKIFLFVFFSLLNIAHLVLCVVQDSKENKLVEEMERQISAYENALTGIIGVSQSNALNLNSCIHDYKDSKRINNNLWSYKKACYELCSAVHHAVSKLANSNCEISYVRLNEKIAGEISMFAYKNEVQQPPKLLNKKRNFLCKENTQYYDMRMFSDCISETQVLFGSDAINNHFFRTAEEREKKPNKYNQFVTIPVFCEDTKMIGLLQIACFDGCSIGEDAEVVKNVAERYFVPYANLFLLLHKIEKALQLIDA